MAEVKKFLAKFGIHYRIESCVQLSLHVHLACQHRLSYDTFNSYFVLTLIQEPEEKEVEEEKKDDGVMRIMFDPPHYTVMESVGSFEVIQSFENEIF